MRFEKRHATLPRGEREEGLGGGTPSHFLCLPESYNRLQWRSCNKTVFSGFL